MTLEELILTIVLSLEAIAFQLFIEANCIKKILSVVKSAF